MNYVITGEEPYLINRKRLEIIKECKVDDMNVITYDADKDDLSAILMDCNTMPFFCEHKVVIMKSCKFLGTGTSNFDETALLAYLKEPVASTTLLLLFEGKMDARKKVGKEIKKLCKSFQFNTLEAHDRDGFVKQMLANRKIVMDARTYSVFLDRCGFQMMNISQEIEKLEIYNEPLTPEVIKSLVSKPMEDNVFLLSQALFDQDVKKCFTYVEDFKKVNVEVIALIGLLASQFRFLSQVKVLSMMNKSKREMASELGAHPYRVEKTLEHAHRRDLKQIQSLLNELANLDQNIKMGLVDKNLGFETFLIKNCRVR